MSRKKNKSIQFSRKKKIKDKLFRIGARDYTIITCDTLEHEGIDVAGLCDSLDKTIYINSSAGGEDKETLIHEMVHAAVYEYGLYQHCAWDSSLEEVVAEVMSKILFANFHLRPKT